MTTSIATRRLDIVITEVGGVRLTKNRLSGKIHLRYGCNDPLGSASGETDGQGNITSREEYYPYGGSAGADEEASEITDRTKRYSGKECDATGLFYYGWRYFQPDAGRWLSADPGGLIDGPNLFRFCHNNPLVMSDIDGLSPQKRAMISSKNPEEINSVSRLGLLVGSWQYKLQHAGGKPGKLATVAPTDVADAVTSASQQAIPDERLLLGYHGTSSAYEQSLSQGINIDMASGTSAGSRLGKGFYITDQWSTAKVYGGYAIDNTNKLLKPEQEHHTDIVFAVYAKSGKALQALHQQGVEYVPLHKAMPERGLPVAASQIRFTQDQTRHLLLKKKETLGQPATLNILTQKKLYRLR